MTCSDDARHRIWQVGFEFEDSNNAAQLRGWAETPKIIQVGEGITNQAGEATPCASKIRISYQEKTPDFVCSDFMLPDTNCWNCNSKGQASTPCATCLCVLRRKSPRTKRKLEDLQDAGVCCSSGLCKKHAVLLPVREGNQESRVGLETRGARRLFSPHKQNIIEQSSISSQQPDSDIGSDTILSSPTLNLPNYVLDGTSPHHHCSQNVQFKENVNWLTKLRKEKMSSGVKQTGRSAQVTPKRRLTRSRSHDFSKGTSPKGNSETLWRFFRIAGKPNGEALNYSGAQGESSLKVLTVEP